ncbi:hypothetical protein [Kordiimonas sp. SCSIO 12610]|uniref:hypothetical protein n=1 Tax=Kordiimonas sp. SCSIO 12610 TaxID=2829597 RepID=UPI002108CB12|nr:hypothetical protein [Kordiimonas sp. SCSIO 12610]UTW54869.1 hypothetical protein KFF44_13810 [Kordiimonas sp. SCSIO 12610]
MIDGKSESFLRQGKPMAEWRNRSLVVKERFQDWDIFHKSVVLFFVLIFSAALARGVFVVEGGTYLVTEERIVSFDAEQIYPWIAESENRARWQAQVTEFLKFSGTDYELGSTRRAYYRRDGEEWFAFEQTNEIEANRKYKTVQQDDVQFEARSLEVTIEPMGNCSSKVVMTEVIFPNQYSDRYWAFLDKGAKSERLKVSLAALDRWLNTADLKCSPN